MEIKEIEERILNYEQNEPNSDEEVNSRYLGLKYWCKYLLSKIKELEKVLQERPLCPNCLQSLEPDGSCLTCRMAERVKELETRIAELVDKFAQSQIEKQIYKRSSLDGDDKIDELKVRVKELEAILAKIKSDPSIGKLEVQDWPENPDY